MDGFSTRESSRGGCAISFGKVLSEGQYLKSCVRPSMCPPLERTRHHSFFAAASFFFKAFARIFFAAEKK